MRRGLCGFAKWPVKSGAVFCRVGKNGDVLKSVFIEHFSNCADAAVHHVRRRDNVGAGARVRKRLLRQNLECRVIRHFSVLDDAAVAVIGVFAQADVGNDQQFQIGLSNALDGALHHALRTE